MATAFDLMWEKKDTSEDSIVSATLLERRTFFAVCRGLHSRREEESERERESGGGGGLGGGGVGPGEHGRGSQGAADLVWFLHIDNTTCRAARQGTFNLEIVCVYARRRGLIYCVRCCSAGQLRVQPELEPLVWLFFFGFFGDSQRTGGEILTCGERRHKDCVSALFIFALWNICWLFWGFFPLRTQRCFLHGKSIASWRNCSLRCAELRHGDCSCLRQIYSGYSPTVSYLEVFFIQARRELWFALIDLTVKTQTEREPAGLKEDKVWSFSIVRNAEEGATSVREIKSGLSSCLITTLHLHIHQNLNLNRRRDWNRFGFVGVPQQICRRWKWSSSSFSSLVCVCTARTRLPRLCQTATPSTGTGPTPGR